MATNADVNVTPSKLTTTGATSGYLKTTDGADSFQVVSSIPSADVEGSGAAEIADDSITPAKIKRLGSTDGGGITTPSDIADWYVVCADVNPTGGKVTAAPDRLSYAKVNSSLIADAGITTNKISATGAVSGLVGTLTENAPSFTVLNPRDLIAASSGGARSLDSGATSIIGEGTGFCTVSYTTSIGQGLSGQFQYNLAQIKLTYTGQGTLALIPYDYEFTTSTTTETMTIYCFAAWTGIESEVTKNKIGIQLYYFKKFL